MNSPIPEFGSSILMSDVIEIARNSGLEHLHFSSIDVSLDELEDCGQ